VPRTSLQVSQVVNLQSILPTRINRQGHRHVNQQPDRQQILLHCRLHRRLLMRQRDPQLHQQRFRPASQQQFPPDDLQETQRRNQQLQHRSPLVDPADNRLVNLPPGPLVSHQVVLREHHAVAPLPCLPVTDPVWIHRPNRPVGQVHSRPPDQPQNQLLPSDRHPTLRRGPHADRAVNLPVNPVVDLQHSRR